MAWYNNIFNRTKSAPISYNVDSASFYSLFGNDTFSGNVSDEQAMRLNTVYSCVKILSETVSSLPCHLYRLKGDGKEVHYSPLCDLIKYKPNDWQTAPEFFSHMMTSLLMDGNFYAYINRTSSGRVIEILPVPHESVSVKQDSNYNIIYEISFQDGKSDVLTQDDILHIKNISLDGVKGMSPLTYNAHAINNAIAARDYAGNVFANDATPRGILGTEGILSDDAYNNIKESWNSSYQGTSNAHKIAILEQGLKFTPMSMSPADVQLLEARKYSRTEICSMYRVPPHMVADLERATFSNIAHQDLAFYKATILPYLTNIESRLNRSLLNVNTQFFKFDVSNLLRTDLESRVASYKTLIETGVMSPNEAREKLDMNPREGGDQFIIGSNNLDFGNNTENNNND